VEDFKETREAIDSSFLRAVVRVNQIRRSQNNRLLVTVIVMKQKKLIKDREKNLVDGQRIRQSNRTRVEEEEVTKEMIEVVEATKEEGVEITEVGVVEVVSMKKMNIIKKQKIELKTKIMRRGMKVEIVEKEVEDLGEVEQVEEVEDGEEVVGEIGLTMKSFLTRKREAEVDMVEEEVIVEVREEDTIKEETTETIMMKTILKKDKINIK
jgi:hypothetical protein